MATSPVSSPSVAVRRPDGSVVANRALDPGTFGLRPNVALMHQVVTAQLAAARAGTQSTKTRAEVSGGGAKPWRQKGTGRARQGSSRAPHWAGGGVALGPKPRSYRQKTPKKMVALALRSALSDRAAEGRVAVVESWGFERPRTRDARALLDTLGVEGRALIVVGPEDDQATLSFRNLPRVHVLLVGELNAYDVLCADWVVFSAATLPGGLGDTVAGAAPTAPAPAPQPAASSAPAAGTGPAPVAETPAEASTSEATASEETAETSAETTAQAEEASE